MSEPERHGGFGATLKDARARYGWTLEEAATRFQVSPRQLLRYEDGSSQPTLGVVERVADLLAVSLDEVVGRAQKRAQPLAIELDVDGVKYRAVRQPRS